MPTKPKNPSITQPKIRQPGPQERIVRVAGLKFILPCNWSPGDVLDEETAAFLNAAWHTAAINGFSERRRELLADPRTTYEILDEELQGFYDVYRRTTRKPNSGAEPVGKTDEEKKLYAFARPQFNAIAGGKKLTRKDYEALFETFVATNKLKLQRQMANEAAAMSELTDQLNALFD